MKVKKILGLTLSAALAVSAVVPWTGMTVFAGEEPQNFHEDDVHYANEVRLYIGDNLKQYINENMGTISVAHLEYDSAYTRMTWADKYYVNADVTGSETSIPDGFSSENYQDFYDGVTFLDWDISEDEHIYFSLDELEVSYDWDTKYLVGDWGEWWNTAKIIVDLKDVPVVETKTITIKHVDENQDAFSGIEDDQVEVDADTDMLKWANENVKDYIKDIEGYEYDTAITFGETIIVKYKPTTVTPPVENAIVNIRYMDGDTFVAGGDYPFEKDSSVKFGDLTLPEGYELDTELNNAESGFVARDGAQIIVHVKKIENPEEYAIVNIRYMDGDTFVAGGDYPFEKDSSIKFGDLTLPEGYELDTELNNAESGFMARDGAQIIVHVKKIENPEEYAIVNIRYMDGDTFVAGGDYPFEKDSSVKFGDLTLPEGYELDTELNNAESGFMARDGAQIIVHVKKISNEVIMNIRFMDGDTFVAGGDYFLPAGVQNYNILMDYVPEGYVMEVAGDFMVTDGGQLDVPVKKITNEIIMNIRFMYGDEFIAGGDYFVPAGVQNYSILEKYVPEGYKMAVSGDFMAVDGGKLIVPLEKDGTPVDPEDPDDDDDDTPYYPYIPSNPDDEDIDDEDTPLTPTPGEDIDDEDTPLTPSVPDAVPGSPEDGDPAGEAIEDDDVAKTDAPPQTGRKVAGSLALLAGAAVVAAVTLKKRED